MYMYIYNQDYTCTCTCTCSTIRHVKTNVIPEGKTILHVHVAVYMYETNHFFYYSI